LRGLGLTCALLLAALVASRATLTADEARGVHLRLDALEQAQGRADAPVTVVEFTDYQCPYCRRFQAETWPRLKRSYVDSGKVRFIIRDLPLEFHSAARPAAEAAHCAGEQGQFWPMHEALLASDTKLTDAAMMRRAQALGLDLRRFRDCVRENKYEPAIARNAAQAASLGVHGTPSFIIGRAAVDGELAGVRVAGALPYEDFVAYLDQLLAGR
jgi:protein-disulfide isomerase